MIKRIVKLLIGGFVGLSIAVAFIPSITGMNLAAVTNPATLALLTIAQWVLPLAVGFVLVMLGIRSLKKR